MHFVSVILLLFSFVCILNARVHPVPIKEDPETHMNVIQILSYWKYPGQEHHVITKDGYNLTIHRIPHGRNNSIATKGVVYLQHCLLCSSADFLLNLPSESLGFMLADQGYDVWMGNIRGNFYSRSHVTLKPSDPDFWKFSFDEHSLIDLPAMIDYVLNNTGKLQLKYIAHSQGTLMGFLGFSSNKELASKIKIFAAMAPVLYVGHTKGLIKFIAERYYDLDLLIKLLGINEFLPSGKLSHTLAELFCGKIDAFICEDVIFAICGPDQTGFNKSRLVVYVSHTPAGTSVQNMLHWGQAALRNNVTHFDYGKKENMKKYNLPYPPAYDPFNIQIPIALYHGEYDWLVQPKDYQQLSKLPNIVYQKELETFEHLDFIWSIHAAKLVYSDIIELFEKY
ncbi:Gastric triacylglycerol lipase-like [Oopsacas minuta]|uniref:Lipase n=1 Tax=Oopsacas minuta TaxID=111878 RepID=A0AAV7JCZ2_9METZ|nr:Gastric triacylglycerol lipase-like [Oopsacas minuta]